MGELGKQHEESELLMGQDPGKSESPWGDAHSFMELFSYGQHEKGQNRRSTELKTGPGSAWLV